ncbi:PREDICTED: uncharacterized protein C1orf158 homolog [Thamnophis sirtalis]|uniref:Uncharacterized protein C1orf158 homolog n=1 Tax=Thamnophis sirtalis TaxID=35019 RepID=A0A6I9YRJ1_9SAUR|nr:PREDICTED: uncharacterized protein C1orf158 homolog [Thamnophis sirtalis]
MSSRIVTVIVPMTPHRDYPGLGRVLENLRLCSQLQFVRFVRNAWTRRRDAALRIQDAAFQGVPVRLYLPKAPAAVGPRTGIVYFHGGGWLFGSRGSQEHLCCYLARESGSVVVSVGYRLAPEHRHPAQLNDCLAASTHFLKVAEDYGVDSSWVILAGNEAGGNLAARVCQILASRPGPTKFVRENEGTGLSTFKQDFVPFPTGAPDRTVMRRLMKRLEGLPRKYILTHCEEPRHQHLVSQYEDQYNRHGHNPHLPPLRKWDRHKLAWTPEKSDYPLVEPPTSYGLLEHLMETWHRKEPGVGESTYHSSYPKPPASAYAPRQRPDARRILQQSRKQWLPRSLDAPA